MAPEGREQQSAPIENTKPSVDDLINTALTDKALNKKERNDINQKYQEYLDGKVDIKDETKLALKQFLSSAKGGSEFEKFKKTMLSKLDSKPTGIKANEAPLQSNDNSKTTDKSRDGSDQKSKLADKSNAAPAAPESTETSKVTYKLESADVIKTAIASLDHNSTNSINQEQIIGSYVDSEGKEQKIVLKGSSSNLRVELDGSGTLDDTDLKVEKSDFESIKKAVTTLIEQYKKEILTKNGGKAPDKKGDKAPDIVNENEKKVGNFTKLDGKTANIMLFRYANQNNGDSINDKPYRYTVELDKSDKFIDPSINFDHEPTADELKTAISKLIAEYEIYKSESKQKETKAKESESKSKFDKENQGKITEITKLIEELKLKPSDIAPKGIDMDQWSQWIKEFSNTNEIMLNVTNIDISKGTVEFDFDDSAINEKFNTKLLISGAIKDGKIDLNVFKKSLPEQVTKAIKSMVDSKNTSEKK